MLFDSNGSTTYTPAYGQRTNGTDGFSHPDWLGSTRYLTDSSGNGVVSALRYDSFGQRSASSSSTPPSEFLYAGRAGYQTEYSSATDPGLGLQYLQQRYYDPAVGRFLTPDPIGLAGGLNPYRYAGNDPVDRLDPSGMGEGSPEAHENENKKKDEDGDHAAGGGDTETGDTGPPGMPGMGTGGNSGSSSGPGIPLDGLGNAIANAANAIANFFNQLGNAIGGLFSGGPCFPAGTPIRTRDGVRPIEQIRVGDLVLSADPDTGKQSYQRVEKTFVHPASELLTIVTEDGRGVEVTPNHPMWVEGRGFIAAGKLARSDLLRDVEGYGRAITKISARKGEFTVYNFTVAETHTYYAGEDGWWVHNTCDAAGDDPVGGVGGGAGPGGGEGPFMPDEWYRDKRQGRAPINWAPYGMYERFDDNGDLHQVTTYDQFGARARQFDLGDDALHGEGVHVFEYGPFNRSPGGGIRSDHIPLDQFGTDEW